MKICWSYLKVPNLIRELQIRAVQENSSDIVEFYWSYRKMIWKNMKGWIFCSLLDDFPATSLC